MVAAIIANRPTPGPRARRDVARGLVRRRALLTLAAALSCYAVLGGQLLRLALRSAPEIRASMAEPLAGSWSRPDIVDRNGRLLASDVAVNSLYADPHLILDLDEVLEKLVTVLPGLDAADLRKELGDRSRRFAWIARALTPRLAQQVLDLGLPGLAFRLELRRAYPLGSLAGHVLGAVNTDNKGVSGLELTLDRTGRTQAVQGVVRDAQTPVRLSLDVGVQHALAEELKAAAALYKAPAAAALVLDVANGEVLASVSLPEVDPNRPADWLDAEKADRLTGGTYELGSVFKLVTVAMALEDGIATLDKIYDVRQPLTLGGYTISDLHAAGRPLSVRDDIGEDRCDVPTGHHQLVMIALDTLGHEALVVRLVVLRLLEADRVRVEPVSLGDPAEGGDQRAVQPAGEVAAHRDVGAKHPQADRSLQARPNERRRVICRAEVT